VQFGAEVELSRGDGASSKFCCMIRVEWALRPGGFAIVGGVEVYKAQ